MLGQRNEADTVLETLGILTLGTWKVDQDVITRLQRYGDFSPTIRLFEYLEVKQPDMDIQQLKKALLEIKRNDLFSLLTTKGNYRIRTAKGSDVNESSKL